MIISFTFLLFKFTLQTFDDSLNQLFFAESKFIFPVEPNPNLTSCEATSQITENLLTPGIKIIPFIRPPKKDLPKSLLSFNKNLNDIISIGNSNPEIIEKITEKGQEIILIKDSKKLTEKLKEKEEIQNDNFLFTVPISNEQNIHLNGDGTNLAFTLQNQAILHITTTSNSIFNINLQNDGKSVLHLNSSANVILSGEGNLEVNSESDLKLSKIVLNNQKMNLKSAKSIEFDELESYQNSFFIFDNNDNHVVFKHLTLKQRSKLEIKNSKIIETVDLNPFSTLKIDNVDLTNAEVKISVSPNRLQDISFYGKLSKPPKSIQMQSSSNLKMLSNDSEKIKLAISENEFAQCEQWISKIHFGNTKYSSASCSKFNEKQGTRNILLSSTETKEDGKGGLSGGAIAAIVICVLVVVVTVCLVVYFVVKKRKVEDEDGKTVMLSL